MKPKRKKKPAEHDARWRKLQDSRKATHTVSMASFDPRREVDYIAECAARRDGRIVTLGVLVFFSTDSGDAWMLDAEDSMAMCVARDGKPESLTIIEMGSKVGIEWTGHFAIDGDAFTVTTDGTGRIRTILGYPTAAIQAALAAAVR